MFGVRILEREKKKTIVCRYAQTPTCIMCVIFRVYSELQ